jgi:hypothetical protein
VIEHGIVGVNVIVLHAKVKELLIGLLFFGSVGEGGSESISKFGPEDFVVLLEIAGG